MSRTSRSTAGRGDLPVTIVHACLRGTSGGGGSPTAVLNEASSPCANGPLTDDERRGAAALAGTSHAVFLSDERDGEDGSGHNPPVFAVRFFTSEGELPACGHGTVAALAFLAEHAGGQEYRANLRVSGRVIEGRVLREASSSVRVAFTTGPVGLRELAVGELAVLLPALGLSTTATSGACVATLGRPRLLLSVTNRAALAALAPDPDHLAAACDQLGLLGCFVHSPMSVSGRVTARMFAPSIGVPEDIANANSSACLATHLLTRQGTTGITVDMGDALGCPSTITADTRHTSSGLLVDVTGAARIGEVLHLPRQLFPAP